MPPPNADRPNDGQVKFGVEVGPMGCMGYENTMPVSNYAVGDAVDGGQVGSGGGGDVPYIQRLKSNRILRLLERTLIIGNSIDAEALCVQSGVWVWRLHVDVSLLDDGGNAMDACVLAAVAALRHYRLPEVSIGGDSDDVSSPGHEETNIIHSDDREPTPLPLHHTPLTSTFALFADETGTTTAVSALLDPFDREELACDGLLTWSYNKYGEMCCLDFPGGCELRPRQLMASSNLGKRRCIEICELLETALEEAESKAHQDRMDRLKQMNAMRQGAAIGDNATMEDLPAIEEEDEEDEKYRLRALDYSSGHIAASVKEDKDKKGSQGKNMKGETSSLFHAILRSAQSTSLDKRIDENDEPAATSTNSMPAEKKSTVEIVAHKAKQPTETAKPKQKKTTKQAQVASLEDSDEEEVVQLQSEFTTVEQASEAVSDQVSAAPMEIDPDDGTKVVEKEVPRSKKSKSATRTTEVEEDDVDDLAMAVKKKKKTKKSKKK